MAQTHRTIDRRKAKNDDKSVAERLAAAKQEKKTTPAASAQAAAQNTSRGSYYSPRQYGTNAGQYEAQVKAAQAAMEERSAALTEQRKALEQARSDEESKRKRYYDLSGMLEGEDGQQRIKALEDEWTASVEAYGTIKSAYDAAYQEYRPYELAYNKAVEDYDGYVTAEQTAYQDWRGTIRDAESIREEQRTLAGSRAELKRLMMQSNDIAEGRAAPGVQALARQIEARIAELQAYLGGKGDREKLLSEELEWSNHFLYEDLRANADFAEKSGYQSTATGAEAVWDNLTGGVQRSGFGDRTYDFVNRNADAAREILNDQAMHGGPYNDMSYLRQMTEDEIKLYNYVYATQGAQAANGYLEHLRTRLTARQTQAAANAAGEAAAGSIGGAIAGSIGSVLLSPASGIQSMAGQVMDWATGRGIDPNATYALSSNVKNAIREAVSAKIVENAGPVGSFAYGTVMSMADMLADAAVGNPTAAMAMIGSRAFSEQVIDAKNRGLSDGQALVLGVASGAAELITEKIGLDELLKLPDGWEDAGFWKGLAKGAWGEAKEEGLTNVMNLAADLAIAGDQSELIQNVERYKREGLSEGEASLAALKDAGISLGADMLGGALSGGVFGGVQGLRGKKAAKTKAENTTEPPGNATATPGNATEAPDNATVREDRTVEKATAEEGSAAGKESLTTVSETEMVREQEATGANNAQVEGGAVGAENATTDGEAPDGNVGETVIENGGAKNESAGERVLHGEPERHDGESAGEPDGGYAEHRERQQTQARSQAEAAAQRRVKAENLEKLGRLQRVSARDLGLKRGTEVQELLELPRYEWDQELYDTVSRLEQETGYKVRTVTGNIGIRNRDGSAGLVRGYIDRVNGTVVLNVSHSTITAGQIADHELYHWKCDAVDRISGDRSEVTRMAMKRIREEFDGEDLDAMIDAYVEGYGDVYDMDDAEEFLDRVYEEIIADAYAGINAFGTAASRYHGSVNGLLEENGLGRDLWNVSAQQDYAAPGGDQRIYTDEDAPPMPEYEDYSQVPEGEYGPEDDWQIPFSYGGENARSADREAMERAQRMEEQGFDKRQIFRDTGWFRGADGKWRFEIDDSEMQYTQRGDLGFRERNPGYARYRELLDKSNRHVLGLSDDAPTEQEREELKKLSTIWRGTFQKPGRITEDALPQDRITDYIRHNKLFEAYPQLRKTTLRFAQLQEGVRGQYDPSRDEITLNENLRKAPEDTLIHEIQHAIQEVEGFAKGASTEFWDGQQVAKPEYQEEIRKAQDAVGKVEARFHEEWTDDINLNLAKQYIELDDRLWSDESDSIMQQELADQMEQIEELVAESGWEDLFHEYYYAVGELQLAKERAKLNRRTSFDLYRNTAGEIEARNAANRRGLSAEERKKRLPDTGDERTVFVEGNGVRFSVEDKLSAQSDITAQFQATVDQILNNQNVTQDHLIFGYTPDVFTALGMPSLPFTIGTGHVYSAAKTEAEAKQDGKYRKGVHYHGLGATAIKNIYDSLKDPVAIIASKDVSKNATPMRSTHSIVAIVDIGTVPKSLLLPVEITAERSVNGVRMDVNALSSVYERNVAPLLKEAVALENIGDVGIFYAKKEAMTLPGAGVRFPTQLQRSIASNGIVHRFQDKVNMNIADTTQSQQFKRWFGDWQNEPQKSSKIVNEDGTPKVVYHGTNAKFYTFDTRSETYWFSENEDYAEAMAEERGGKRIIAAYLNMKNPYRVTLPPDKFSDPGAEATILREARAAGHDGVIIENDTTDPLAAETFYVVFDSKQIKSATDNVGSFNSADPDIRFSVDDELTREDYDRLMAEVAGDQSKRNEEFVRGKLTPEQYRQFKEFRAEDNRDAEEAARLRGIERFEEAMEQEDLAVLRAQQAEDAAAGRRELRREEKAAREEAQAAAEKARKERKQKTERKKEQARKEAAERIAKAAENAKGDSAPTIARKELQDRLIGLFSVGEGQRGELRKMIGDLADRMIVEGSLDEGDLRNLINRLYDAGVMVIEPEEIYAEGRSYVKDEHIYISPELIRELGDDWQTLRKKAWGLGVYLSTDRQYAGLDVWNKDLASYLPGMFNAEETDQRTMLERILMIAEEGKAEKISLTEYTKRIAKAEHQSEQELLFNLERQVEEALRTFAEKASLETRLKDRANRRAAMDREKNAIAREQERIEREALRQELADDREALRSQNEKARQALEDRRAEYERQNAAERRRIAEERRARREKTQQAKRKKELRELQQKTLNALQWIAKNRRRAPEAMQEAFDEVLGDIDLYCISMADEMAWSSKHQATWKDLKAMYLHAREHDPNFLPSDDLQKIVDRLDKTQLEELDFDQLRGLYQAAVGLRTEYQQRNNVISDSEWEMMEEVYSGCVEEMKTAPKKLSGLMDRFLNLEQLTPMNVLAEMGGFNPNGMLYRFAKQLEDGERNVRGFTVKANRILADFLEENKDWVHKADGQGKDGEWVKCEIPELLAMKVGEEPQFGETVTVWMTPLQRVHLYLESRNHDNLRHMTGGRTFVDKELYSKGEREEAFAKGTTIRMAPETVQLIVKNLTPQELELANLLDRYYNDLAKTEINKVSNVLLGYDKAMGGKYAPIFTNQNYTKSEFGKFDGTAEGAGNLKERVKSKVPSYNISALDAFERNMNRTATYVGMAIPVRNWNTLMNWRTERSSFADEMTHAWGEGRRKYIEDLITDLQNPMGEQQDLVAEAASKLQSNYISSVFGFNPGIVVKQLGSIPMASAYLEWKHFPRNAIGKGKIDRELIGKYTPDLEWRTMGYSMPETKQLKDAPNWSQKNKTVGLIFGGDAITAMDGWAASVLWPWAENKVRADFPGLEVGDAAMIENGQSPFYKKVAEVFNDAVARSQSVSDQMHQGRLRKSKNLATKALTMFRSDTAQSYNVLRQLLGEMDYYKRMGKNHAELAEKTRAAVGAAVTAIAINSLWGTTVDLIVQALKGKLDDEEKEPMAILENFFWGAIESYAGLSAAGDILAELVGGWFTGGMRYDTEAPGVEQFNDIMQAMDKVVNAGKKGNWLGAVKTAAETIASYGGGIPVKNVEAYLKGILSMVLPGVVVGYEDLLKAPTKADLKGLEGDGLMVRLNNVLKGYGMKLDRESREAMAKIYEQGYKEAVPSAAPDAVTIEGVELELDERMRKAYDKTRGGIIERELAQIAGSAFFTDADAKTQKSMLTKLYNYAAEKAKDSVLADYEISSSAMAIDEIIASGGSAADYAVFDAATATMAAWQKALVLREWGTNEAVTGLMFKHLVSKSWEDEQAALREVGVDMGQFLELYAMHGEIDGQDLKAGQKATQMAYWLDGQRYSDAQKAAIKEQMTFFQFMPAEASRYNTATAAGLDRDQALELTEKLDKLEPPEGKTSVQDIQKYRVAIDDSVSESNQLKMLAAVGLKDTSYDKVKTGYEMGVAPAAWVRAKEVQLEYDANGNGSMTNAEWEAAVEGICAYGIVLPGDTQRFNMTNEQKAILWQMLVSKSTKATNNPFSAEAGRRWREAMGYE